jgi:ATP-dependent DNA helicase RecQ
MREQAAAHLARALGPDARFRPGQLEAILAVVEDRARILVVQRTGWGKSLVYWIATRMRRDNGAGPSLVISPLLSLMRDQIRMAGRLGLRALTINSANTEQWDEVRAALESGECDVLLISPERLGNEAFLRDTLPGLRAGIGLLVVDEAHCISDWGHDFRPDYRRIQRILALLPRSVPVLGTTATANDRVVADASEQLGEGVQVFRGPLARDSLRLQVIALADQAERLAWLAEHLPRMPGSGIVYCLTVADTRRVAGWLRRNGINAFPYNADMLAEERCRLEEMLLRNECKALVATVALGMGFDKPDLGFVVHYQRPGSPIAYYQQVGRAGRAVELALGILLTGREDDDIQEYFISTAFPPTIHMHEVLRELEGSSGMTVAALETRVNLARGQLEKALKLLEIDGAVGHERGHYFRTPLPWAPDLERIERITAARWAELGQMQAYVEHRGCLMEFLTSALDDPDARPCGRCATETGPFVPATTDSALVVSAAAFLRGDSRPIVPRKMWPVGADPELAGRIDPPNEPGHALAIYGDAGWGRAVARGKYETGAFDADLTRAAVEFIRGKWRPAPAPRWVTAIPSARHPALVGRMATQIAAALGVPFVDVLAASASAHEQKSMQNSAQQVRNVRQSLRVAGDVPPGPVLLVDDIVDSGWTLTIAGWLLRTHGSGPVHPFALACASTRNDS